MAPASFPLVALRPVANAQNEWVALLLKPEEQATDDAFLEAVFGPPDLLAAIDPLDCIVPVADPATLTPAILELLPPSRVVLAVPGAALGCSEAADRVAALQRHGYRVLLDGAPPEGIECPPALRSVARDCRADAPPAVSLPALFGPHLAYGVDDGARFHACENAGFTWFGGDYALDTAPATDDGTSRRRLLSMLALLARDAATHDLEFQLKQDPALSYHLLKLVNSAAFSSGVHVTTFAQAIGRIGRRQLQRWLQLLLYAHPHPDGPANLLLPLAAQRGAALEALCQHDGGTREAQDQAFMTGVFSLLDRLFHTPMTSLVPDLDLAPDVAAALQRREGQLGRRLQLAEAAAPDAATLAAAGTDAATWWTCQLHACHWAIQVARHV